MAARPLAVVTDDWELALLGVLVTGGDKDASEEQLCELGKRCSGQNFWWHFYITTQASQTITCNLCQRGNSRHTVSVRTKFSHTWALRTLVPSWPSVTDQS